MVQLPRSSRRAHVAPPELSRKPNDGEEHVKLKIGQIDQDAFRKCQAP